MLLYLQMYIAYISIQISIPIKVESFFFFFFFLFFLDVVLPVETISGNRKQSRAEELQWFPRRGRRILGVISVWVVAYALNLLREASIFPLSD